MANDIESAASKYFNGDQLAANVWLTKYALKDSGGNIVEDTPDVLAIQNTNHYSGLFHVIGGLISPIDGIGPENLNIDSLVKRVKEGEIKEIIFALSPTLDGDTTSFYISKRLSQYNLKMTTISRGIPIGGEIEYADEITLGKSISSRISYKLEDE